MSFPVKRAESPLAPAERTALARVLFDRARAGRAFDALDQGPCRALHLPVRDSEPRCCRILARQGGFLFRAERIAHDPEWLFSIYVSNPFTEGEELVLFATYPDFRVHGFEYGSWQNDLVAGSYLPPSGNDGWAPHLISHRRTAP